MFEGVWEEFEPGNPFLGGGMVLGPWFRGWEFQGLMLALMANDALSDSGLCADAGPNGQ